MDVSSPFMDVSRPNIHSRKNYAKNSRIFVFVSYFRQLHLFVLPLLLGFTVLSLPINVANRFLSLLNGCNLSPNHVFLVLNSIIAAIAATTKLSRVAEPPVERIQNVTAINPDTDGGQRKVESVHSEFQQLTLRSAEQNSNISALDSKARESFREDGIDEQERQVIPESKHNPEDGFTRSASSFQDGANEEVFEGRINSTEAPLPHQAEQQVIPERKHNPEDGFTRSASSFQDAAIEEVFKGRMNSTETPLPHQAAPGNSLEEIWREITDKRHRHSSGRQLRESSNRVNNQAIRRAPTSSRVALLPIPSSPCKFELPEVPELKSKSLKREPSAGLQELNRKAEEFITRFSEQMRLQRQESMIRYMRMNNTAIRT